MNGDVDSRMNNLMEMTGMEDKIWSLSSTKNAISLNQKAKFAMTDNIRKNSFEFVVKNISYK